MDIIQKILVSPAIAQMLLVVLFLEAIGLLAFWWLKGKGLPPAQTISFLGAGAALSAALLVVLSNASPFLLAIALICAFMSHVIDLSLRWNK